MNATRKSSLAIVLTVALISLSAGQSGAMLAPALPDHEQSVRTQDMKKVQAFLEQTQVAQHLAGLGLNTSEIESRLNNLSNQELHRVATQIENEQPGRDGAGIIVTVLVIGILALLFMHLYKRV